MCSLLTDCNLMGFTAVDTPLGGILHDSVNGQMGAPVPVPRDKDSLQWHVESRAFFSKGGDKRLIVLEVTQMDWGS